MADRQQPLPKTQHQRAEDVQKIRHRLAEQIAGQDLTPAERAFKEALDGIMEVLDDLARGHDDNDGSEDGF